MKSRLDQRTAPDLAGGAGPAQGSAGNKSAWLVLLRVPDMQPVSASQVAETVAVADQQIAATLAESTSFEPNSPVDEPLETHAAAEQDTQAESQRKDWRGDAQHATFRPEKFRSNVSTKLVAGLLSIGAIVLVYYALFGGSGEKPEAVEAWATGEFEEEWTDENGELEVDLGMESEIGESSPIAPPFAAEPIANVPLASEPQPTDFAPPGEWSPQPVPAEVATQADVVQREQPEPSALNEMLPWNNEPAMPTANQNQPTPAARPSVDAYAPGESHMPLNAPLTQAAPTQPGYASQYQGEATSPAANPAPNYPATDYPSTNYPATNYPSTAAPSQYQLPTQPQTPQGPSGQAASGPRPWSNTPSAAPSYPTTGAPAPAYSPGGSNYPSTQVGNRPYNSDTPREWRR